MTIILETTALFYFKKYMQNVSNFFITKGDIFALQYKGNYKNRKVNHALVVDNFQNLPLTWVGFSENN